MKKIFFAVFVLMSIGLISCGGPNGTATTGTSGTGSGTTTNGGSVSGSGV